MKRYFFLLFILTFSQCTSKYNANIETVLDNVSSKQAADLEAVLDHYTSPQDSLKRKAAYFLIENFPEDQYQTIDKQLLIENIELAFQVWKKPWAKQLNFEEFKELVLPFNLESDSTGTFWRKRFMNEYAFVEDSLKNYPNEDPAVAACIIVNKILKKKYKFVFDRDKTKSYTLNDWVHASSGDCTDMAMLTNHLMHAIGVPTAIDFTPQWGSINFRHFWNVVLVNKKFLPFMGSEGDPRMYKAELDQEHGFLKVRTKVYRKTYKINTQSLSYHTHEVIPPLFRDKKIIDISNQSIPTQSITISIPDSISSEYVYLCVAHLKKWSPIAWSKVTNGKAVFTAVRPKVVYAPAHYKNGKMVLFSHPFLSKKNGQKKYFVPTVNDKERIVCLQKFPYDNTNLIKIGDTYELLYWDLSGWKSIEKKVATQTSITFENVPKNAILDLKNLTRGRAERVFYYQNNQQIY